MTRWNLSIPNDVDRAVRVLLARTGMKKGDLSAFVEHACRREVLRRTVLELQERNADLTAQEALELAHEAVDFARARPAR